MGRFVEGCPGLGVGERMDGWMRARVGAWLDGWVDRCVEGWPGWARGHVPVRA